MLTDAQRRTLIFIQEFISEHGKAPKLPEIALGIGIQSTGVVHRYVHDLQAAGFIEIEPRRHRGIRLKQNIAVLPTSQQESRIEIPFLGRIAAGSPIEAIPDQSSINFSDLFAGRSVFALEVCGESMIDAGIFNGDTVICESKSTARDGEIVVALVDNEEATLKRLKRDQQHQMVSLIAENKTFPAMHYEAHRVAIQGVLVAQLRQWN